MQTRSFPFTAILGQTAMKTALLVNAVDPTIGGVLLRGQKGTAKSTAVRALAELLPAIECVSGCLYNCPPDQPEQMHTGCTEQFAQQGALPAEARPMPLVELPLSATEDHLVGSLQLSAALEKGKIDFEPGLLARANRGILYVDEVNLLPDHLVDLLLDVSASGINRVEREGFRMAHPARFMLIGTMNPEEGELRPQFLDRFGLCVSVDGLEDPGERAELVRRHLKFETAPEAFLGTCQAELDLLSHQVEIARTNLKNLVPDEDLLEQAAKISLECQVAGHRADIAMVKTARALAALVEADTISMDHLAEAARLVLPHRMTSGPLDNPATLMEKLDIILQQVGLFTLLDKSVDDLDPDDFDPLGVEMEVPGATAAGSMLFTLLKKKQKSAS